MAEFPFDRHRRDAVIFLPLAYCASLLLQGFCVAVAYGDSARLLSTSYWSVVALVYVLGCVASVPVVCALIVVFSVWRMSVERYPLRWVVGGAAVAMALWSAFVLSSVTVGGEADVPPRRSPTWIDFAVPLPMVASFAALMWWRLRRRPDA
ncbi:MAG: hypothetical protein IPK81_21115 [Rhodospirillales bacterium]|nr:MAG: hypothetical protein IPK81_21115 [Rhodospirillales bacterium]